MRVLIEDIWPMWMRVNYWSCQYQNIGPTELWRHFSPGWKRVGKQLG